MGESAEDLHINAVVAPVKKKELTSIHITNAEKENLEKLEKYYEEEIDQDLFERWINKSEEVVTSDIFNTFRCYSIFDKNDTVYSFDEIVQKMQIPEKLHKLTKRWLRVLIKEKVIEEKAGGYQLIQQEKDFDSFKLWDEFYQIENKFGYSRELVDYLKQSSDLLPELIQGKEDPLYDAALAAYGYDIKKRMEKLRMKVVIMYGGNELFAAKSVSLVKEKCVSECEVYAYDNMGHSEVLSLHPEKLCEIIRK